MYTCYTNENFKSKWNMSSSGPRLNYFSGMGRYSDFLLYLPKDLTSAVLVIYHVYIDSYILKYLARSVAHTDYVVKRQVQT